MKNWKVLLIVTLLASLRPVPAIADEIRLKNGDPLRGKIVLMKDNQLILKTSFAGEISIKWEEIAQIQTDMPIQVVLSDGTSTLGIAVPTETGKIKIKAAKILDLVSFDLADVQSINPKPKPVVQLKGRINVGARKTQGNTDTENFHLDGELIARTTKSRFTIGAEADQSKDRGVETVNSVIGYMKYDYFVTEKWFLNSNALFEKDKFQDLNLRTSLGLGIGYQFWETQPLNLLVEAGLNYVNEDYIESEDKQYPAGRWSVNFDKYLIEELVQFFLFNGGLIGLEDTDDVLIKTRTGFRFPHRQFNATLQFNYDWDNTPAEGRSKTDKAFILSLGYSW
jgi:putative salt-induced outer membrane protein YdiY